MTALPPPQTRPTPIERVRTLEELGPRRLAGTPTEKAAQEALGNELAALGYQIDWRPFRWTRSIYASLTLHFGLAALATGVGLTAPLLGAALHALVAISYTLESTKRALLLRNLLPGISSQNLVATRPARGTRKRRVVLTAHSDAAFTGLLFTPALIRIGTAQPPKGFGWFRKSLGVAVAFVALLAVVEGLSAAGVWTAPTWVRGALSIPAVITFALNLDVVLRNRVVPGACDNLSGCTGCVELAHRLEGRLPDDVELVIVITGAEEAGTGGAQRLAEQIVKSKEWTPEDTVVLGLDGLSNGTLYMLEEGELYPVAVPRVLEAAVLAENAARPDLPPVTKFVIPTGATDVMPFLVRGFPAMSLTCVDDSIGAPRHYHFPTDTWRNMDVPQLEASIDFAERLVLRLANP